MPTRNVVLTHQQHALIDALVQTGRRQNASEVLRGGLRMAEDRARFEQAKLNALQQAAAQGWADVAAGRCSDVADKRLEDPPPGTPGSDPMPLKCWRGWRGWRGWQGWRGWRGWRGRMHRLA